jgi:hypothetical protein
MSRVGDSIAVANPPPLPPPEVAESSSAGALRGPKMGSKGRSRTRDSGTPTQQVGSRGGDGDSAPPSERDSPIEPARRDSPIEHGEAPHTPVNGAFVTNASLHTSGGAPKAARRLRDTTAINAAGDACALFSAGQECPFAQPTPPWAMGASARTASRCERASAPILASAVRMHAFGVRSGPESTRCAHKIVQFENIPKREHICKGKQERWPYVPT